MNVHYWITKFCGFKFAKLIRFIETKILFNTTFSCDSDAKRLETLRPKLTKLRVNPKSCTKTYHHVTICIFVKNNNSLYLAMHFRIIFFGLKILLFLRRKIQKFKKYILKEKWRNIFPPSILINFIIITSSISLPIMSQLSKKHQ